MAILTYVLDTNAVTDRINQIKMVEQRLNEAIHDGHRLCLCPPVYYEVIRGLLKTSATRKQQYFEQLFVPALEWVELTTDDWTQAARYWAAATAKGKQLSDVDLLIAALATRLSAIIVSADEDFDALGVRREDWRKTP